MARSFPVLDSLCHIRQGVVVADVAAAEIVVVVGVADVVAFHDLSAAAAAVDNTLHAAIAIVA